MSRIRRISKIVALLLCISTFSGCGNGKMTQSAGDLVANPIQREMTAGDEIVITYLCTPSSILDDLGEVEAALNDITVPTLDILVDLQPIYASDALSDYSMMITQGDDVDLMMFYDQDPISYASRGMLLPLDKFLQKNDALLGVVERGYGVEMDGTLYGIGVIPETPASGTGIWVPKGYLDAAGIAYDTDRIYSLDDFTEIFEAFKTRMPSSYPLGLITSRNNASVYGYFTGGIPVAPSTADYAAISADGKVQDCFETDEYLDFLYHIRKWYTKGYIYPDSAFTDFYVQDLVNEGSCYCYPYISVPGAVDDLFGDGAESRAVCLRTCQVTQGVRPNAAWALPSCCEHPDAAIRFLNAMYEDARIGNLLRYGIEGRHYVVLDTETGRIAYPYGVYADTVGYSNALDLYGDMEMLYSMGSRATIEARRCYVEEARSKHRPSDDFTYNPDEQMTKILADIQEVVASYVPALESGCLDVDTYYPQFLEALIQAGMERLVEDKQQQLDKYLSDL